MSSGWQISAGRIFEWIRPAVFLLTVLVSAWTLRDAQKRGLAGYSALLWTLATLIFPAVAFPLYLALRLWFHEAPDELPEMAEAMTVPVAEDAEALVAEGDEPGDSRHEPVASPQPSDEAVTKKGPTGRASAEDMRSAIFSPSVGVPRLLSPLYLSVLLVAGTIYFYRDYHSLDARRARASDARLLGQHARAAHEYRAALDISDDPHTRKLFGLELAAEGRWEEALAELRTAQQGSVPDGMLSYHIAATLDKLQRHGEADEAYREFLSSDLCSQEAADERCAPVRHRPGN